MPCVGGERQNTLGDAVLRGIAAFAQSRHAGAQGKGAFDMTAAAIPGQRSLGTFHLWMAGLFVLIAFSGFAVTYWLQLPAATFVGRPMLHLHGLLFSAWTLFYFWQTWLIASRQTANHRAWGVAGVSLATAMFFVGMATAIDSMLEGVAQGHAEAAKAFAIVPISGIFLFAIFVGLAVVSVKTPETHKRFMFLATASILQAALGRFFFLAIFGGGPGNRPGVHPPAPVVTTVGAGVIVGLLILAAIVYDWRKTGKPHPVILWGGLAVVALEVLRVPLSATPQWMAMADWFGSFGA
jgi:hypothetical protein